MDNETPLSNQILLHEIAAAADFTCPTDEVEDPDPENDISKAVLSLEQSLDYSVPSLKVQVLQNAEGHELDYTKKIDENADKEVDENLHTEVAKQQEQILRDRQRHNRSHAKKLEAQKKVKSDVDEKLEGLVQNLQQQRVDQVQDMDSNQKKHQENVRLANILTTLAAHGGSSFSSTRRRRITDLCDAVHAKDYETIIRRQTRRDDDD